MPKKKDIFSQYQKEAIADAIAQYFFDIFQNQQTALKRNNEVIALRPGFSGEDFLEPEAMT